MYKNDVPLVRISGFSMTALLLTISAAPASATTEARIYRSSNDEYHYTLKQTGENFSFEFDRNPGGLKERMPAVVHIMSELYDDASIPAGQSHNYTREGAKCFVFDGSFHTYTACFLPNDYRPELKDRFWGFVTRVPNWKWLLTRNVLPAVLLAALLLTPWRRWIARAMPVVPGSRPT